MKIALVVNSFPTFSETFIINKAIALANAGAEIHVIALQENFSKELFKLYKFSSFKNLQIHYLKFPKNKKDFIFFLFKNPVAFTHFFSENVKQSISNLANKVLLSIIKKNNFDIVHFEFSGVAVNFLNILPQIKAKKIVSCRGSAEKVKPLTQPERKEKLKKVFEAVDAIHCVSDDMKNTIAPYCKQLNKVFVNRPAIDIAFFTPHPQKKEENCTNILTIGRFTFQKGYLIGLLAIKKLIDKGIKLKWNIIGDGDLYEEMVFHIHTLQLQQYVFLLGKKNKEEVNEWINKSDIFLLTSVYEGIPNVVLEAMAMQLAVVTTNCGGVEEVIEHGKDGYIAPLYDIDNIAELLETLINNKTLAQELGENARTKIIDSYTLQRQVNVFIETYTKILQN